MVYWSCDNYIKWDLDINTDLPSNILGDKFYYIGIANFIKDEDGILIEKEVIKYPITLREYVNTKYSIYLESIVFRNNNRYIVVDFKYEGIDSMRNIFNKTYGIFVICKKNLDDDISYSIHIDNLTTIENVRKNIIDDILE